jgi:ribonuclease Y
MSLRILFLAVGASGVLGIAIGYFLRHLIGLQQKSSAELRIKQLLVDAKAKAQKSVEEALKKAELIVEKAKEEERGATMRVRKLEERLAKKEEIVENRRNELDREAKELKRRVEKIKRFHQQVEELGKRRVRELERIAGLSRAQAKDELFKELERIHKEDLLVRLRKLESSGYDEMKNRAREILTTVIQRLASSTASEITTTAVSIPSDDLKGRIIGKEGRNIRALERAAGVEIIIDDTPGSVVISSFDPLRRHIARIALENLILDGRIQPARIEDAVAKAKLELDEIMRERGEAAVYEVGILDLDPRLLMLLGRLYFRISYGQNCLQHSIETAHLAGMLAAELGADVAVAKKAALLHDIGKAVDHEIQGSHVEIGRRILKKFEVEEPIILAMQSHHEEYPYETLESVIVQAVDAISAARPGARRDTLENYLKRLEELEKIADSFEGVEKSYAIQAGRELRIFVTPEKISDLEARKLARDVASKIEEEVKYPGEIKVLVIRESRVVEYAK